MHTLTKKRSLNKTMPLGPIERAMTEQVPSLTCDCCYHAAPLDKIHKIDDYLYLCHDCFIHIGEIKKGALREAIERQLLGNVI